MRTKILVILLVISLGINLVVLFTVGSIWMHEKWGHKESHKSCGWHGTGLCLHLALNSEQTKELGKYLEEMQLQISPLKEELRRKRAELLTLVKGEKLENEEMERLLNDISRLQAEVEKIVLQHSIKVRKVLTPEQLAKFNGLFERELCSGLCEKRMSRCVDTTGNR